MARPKKANYLKKTKVIKIMVTEQEFENYNKAKVRLLNFSSPLRSYDILKYCVAQIDDVALLEFLRLGEDDPIRYRLKTDYLKSLSTNRGEI